jgi:nucleoid-associated protein YgaU
MSALTDKYQPLIEAARRFNADDLVIEERNGVLNISGKVHAAGEKQSLWDEYARIDPDMRSGDLVMDIQIGEPSAEEYTVRAGDTLSKIAAAYPGLSWRDIHEANRDKVNDPNKIFVGQKLKIPRAKAAS